MNRANLMLGLLAVLLAGDHLCFASINVENLRCEYRVDPFGVDVPQPRLSWIIQSQQRGEAQTSYQIMVASSPEMLAHDQADLWDSGAVTSDQTLQISYAGKPLASAQRVFWKVRASDAAGNPSPWSATSSWTMGIMNDLDWSPARWIGAPSTLAAPTLMFRRQFDVKPQLRRAIVMVCGLGQYEMTLNGQKVGSDLLTPGWTKYDKTCLYDEYDITEMLHAGANATGLLLGNGMYNVVGGRYAKFKGSFGPQKAIALIKLEYADGSIDKVVTNDQWQVAPGPITFSCAYGGEDYDARLENPTTWTPAAICEGPGGGLRGLSVAAPPIREIQALKPVSSHELHPGTIIYDLGQNASQMVRIKVHGPAGSVVKITPAELLKPDGSVDRSSSGNGEAYWKYTLAGAGNETYFSKFFYHGCRYLQVDLTASTADPILDSIEGVVVHSSAEPTGEFSCSNDLFNRIRTLIRWAQRSNTMSVLTDCPHRERLGWLEQDYLNGDSLRYEADLAALYSKVMNDMADSQTADGLIPDIAPEYTVFPNGFRDSPEWGSAFIQCAWQQYRWDGDVELLRRHYDGMKRYAAYLKSKATDGIVNYGLGDWYDIGPAKPGRAQLTPLSLTATAIYYSDLAVLSNIAKLLGKDDDFKQLDQQARDVRESFNKTLLNKDTGQYATGSQTANAMSLALGLADPADAPRLVDALANDVRSRGNALTAGDIGYRYLLRALADGGRSDVIFDMNNQSEKPGYGMQLMRGATSLTEAWDARTGSQNHFMLGHIIEWFYHDLAGIGSDPDSPAFKKIIIKPTIVGDLTWVKGSYNSARGKITSEWKLDGNQFTLHIIIPANTTATVYIPSTNADSIQESGQPARQSPNLKFISQTKDAAIFTVSSGDYTFTSSRN